MKVSLSYRFYQKMPSHLFSRPFSQESYQSKISDWLIAYFTYVHWQHATFVTVTVQVIVFSQ